MHWLKQTATSFWEYEHCTRNRTKRDGFLSRHLGYSTLLKQHTSFYRPSRHLRVSERITEVSFILWSDMRSLLLEDYMSSPNPVAMQPAKTNQCHALISFQSSKGRHCYIICVRIAKSIQEKASWFLLRTGTRSSRGSCALQGKQQDVLDSIYSVLLLQGDGTCNLSGPYQLKIILF
jgi:hypothetical protein